MRSATSLLKASQSPWLIWGAFAVFGLFGAMVSGLVAATANPLIIALFIAAGGGAMLLFHPILLLWVVIIGALVLAGITELYFPALRQVRWGVVLASVALGGVAILSAFGQRKVVGMTTVDKAPSNVLFFALAFFCASCLSTFINGGASFDDLIGLKSYFQVWGLLLAFAYADLGRITVPLPKFLLWLSALQVPFALHQYLVLVPQRMTLEAAQELIVPVDIVVGTFVGSMDGGGANVSTSTLQLISITFLLALWRSGKIGPIVALTLSALFFVPVALNETKITLLLLPVAMFLLYNDLLVRRPIRSLISGSVIAALLVGVFAIYASSPRGEGYAIYGPKGLGGYWEEMMSYTVGKRGHANLLLNRLSVYPYWFDQHAFGDVRGMLIGHGVGETVVLDPTENTSMRNMTLATSHYSHMGIGLTGLSALLWEVGVLGTVFAVGLFYSAFRLAGRLAQKMEQGFDWAVLKTAQVGLAMLGLSLFHNDYIAFEIGYQTLLMLMLGTVLYFSRSEQSLKLKDIGRVDDDIGNLPARRLVLARLKRT